jgi:DNA-binding response OmpR family regulator
MAKRGIDVTKATSGTAGIEALRKEAFDVAVLDLKMEDMDGIEVLKVFKHMVPRMPVIMLTGHGSEKTARDGLALGASGYLTKPCDLQELLEQIREAIRLERSQTMDAAGRRARPGP